MILSPNENFFFEKFLIHIVLIQELYPKSLY